MLKYFKKTTITLMVVILLCLFSMHSNILFSYGSENDTIKVGFYKWDGFNNMDEEDNLSGYGYEYLEHLSRYNDWNYEFMGYDNTWQESMKMLKTGDIDILCSMIKTAEREKEFLLSEYPMGSKKYTLTTLRNNEDYYLGDIDELNGITVGVFKDNASNELFTNFAKENDINYTMVEAEGSNENDWLIKNLKNGNIDAIFSSEYRITEDEKILTNTGSIEFFIATNKNNHELMGEINQSIKELNSNEPLLATELGKKYFAKSQLGAPNFTREEVDFINSNKDKFISLRAYNTNKPFYWKEGSVAHGIYANIIDEINALTGLKIKLSASNEDIDGLIGVPSNLYIGRTMNLKIADTILEYNYAEIYYDNSNFSRVGLLKGHEEQTDIIESKYKESTLYRFDNFAKCAYAIEHKNVDAIFVDELSAQVIINQIYSNSINIYSHGNLKREESIGINDGNPKELLTIINKCIDPWVINNVDENISEVLHEATDDYNTYDFWASYKQAISVFTIMLLFAFLVIRRIWISNKEKLEKKNEELKSANSAKSEFLGRMSHDMRTPMNAIIGMSEFGMEEINDNKAKEYFGNINHSSKYLLSLLNDVLDLQRIEQGAIELKKDWTDFDEDYQMIVNIIEQRIKEKELKVELDIDDKLKNLLIYTDSIRYRQIMLNLINNSIKYTPKGGQIRVSIKHRELKDKQYLVNMISDNGVGMSESFMEKMYGKFAQEKNSESIDEGGTGLGLSITKNLVMLMGGNIKCSSVLNEGTTFTVTLPIDILKKDEKLSNSKRYTNDELSGKCVLLCEDNKMNALITERILEKAGVEVEKAVNGKEGIEMAKSFKYDAILMDIRMPEVSGIDAAKKIRSFDKIVPIIALSANAYPEDIEMSIKSGMQGHIAKPINRDELYSTLIKWIN